MEEDRGNVTTPAYMVGLCGREQLPIAWGLVKPWIEAALDQSLQHEISITDIAIGLDSGEYLLLLMGEGPDVAPVGVAVLMISEAPRQGRYVGILACGGTGVENWISVLFDAAKVIARSHGAQRIIAMGRVGWRRIMKQQGCKHHASVFSLDVGE
jgi:hypothetical protein